MAAIKGDLERLAELKESTGNVRTMFFWSQSQNAPVGWCLRGEKPISVNTAWGKGRWSVDNSPTAAQKKEPGDTAGSRTLWR